MGLAPAVSVVFVGGLTSVTVMAFTVTVTVLDLDELETEVAVIVAVQSAFRVAVGCGV
jgi:hypothetical protein